MLECCIVPSSSCWQDANSFVMSSELARTVLRKETLWSSSRRRTTGQIFQTITLMEESSRWSSRPRQTMSLVLAFWIQTTQSKSRLFTWTMLEGLSWSISMCPSSVTTPTKWCLLRLLRWWKLYLSLIEVVPLRIYTFVRAAKGRPLIFDPTCMYVCALAFGIMMRTSNIREFIISVTFGCVLYCRLD